MTLLPALQRASAADIRLLSSAFKVGAKVEGHAADRAVFYLLMTAPEHATQGVRVFMMLWANLSCVSRPCHVQQCVKCISVVAVLPHSTGSRNAELMTARWLMRMAMLPCRSRLRRFTQ